MCINMYVCAYVSTFACLCVCVCMYACKVGAYAYLLSVCMYRHAYVCVCAWYVDVHVYLCLPLSPQSVSSNRSPNSNLARPVTRRTGVSGWNLRT